MAAYTQINFAVPQETLEKMLRRFEGLLDDGVTDINVSNGRTSLRRNGRSVPVDIEVENDDMADLCFQMAAALDMNVNALQPVLERRLPPRYRLSFSHPAITQHGGWNMSIRFLPTRTIQLQQYVDDGFIEAGVAARLKELMHTRKTMLIAGPTGSGKSTLLRSLIGEIPERDRVLIIESGAELNVERADMAALEDNDDYSFEQLISHALRLDPDVIVVGEVRGREASRFITIAAAGHPCCTTIHADSGEKALIRLHRMVRLSEPHFDRAELEGAIDAVCHVVLEPETGHRRISLWPS